MREVNGRTKFGRTAVRGVALSSSLRERGRALGSPSDEIGLRVAFTIGRRRMIFSERADSEVQWYLNTTLSDGGYSAYRLVFGSNPAGLLGCGDGDEDLLFAQETSPWGQFVQQWKLRKVAQGAALKQAANCKLRAPLAYIKSFNFTDAQVCGSVIFR